MEIVRIIAGFVLLIISFVAQKLSVQNWLYFVFLATSYFVLAFEVLKETFENITKGQIFDENFLMTVATVGAACVGEYNEAVFVMLFYSIGEYLQDLALEKSKENIKELMDIAPAIARVKNGADFIEVEPSSLKINDIIKVLPGEIIPIDGVVINGSAYVDTSSITGESVPVLESENDNVISGTIVKDSPLIIKATKEYENSTVSRILKLLEENQNKKAPTERFVTKFAKVYTPIVCFSAVLLSVIPSLITGQWSVWIHRSLSFLVISCPCALVLSVPLAFFAGIGNCANNGILVKGGDSLEKLVSTRIFCFDKTGTLTKGEFKIQKIETANGVSENRLMEICYSAEKNSTHPIATSIIDYCKNKNINELKTESLKEIPGKGISASIEGNEYLIGNKKLIDENNIKAGTEEDTYRTVIYVAENGKILGRIIISDTLKSEAQSAVEALKKQGIDRTFILSGDNELAVKSISETVKTDSYYFGLTPEDKINCLAEIEKTGHCAFVGDGINDAPCLVTSYVGISMGGIGSKAAIEASDIVIMTDNLSLLPKAIKISKHTIEIAKQNIAFSLAIKVICLIVVALGFAGMKLAVFADTGVALLAVLNSLRALSNK